MQIPEKDARVGDIVVYFDNDGNQEHSGIVVGQQSLTDLSSSTQTGFPPRQIPQIWSKWGKGNEMVHLVGDCPYHSENVRYYRLKWESHVHRN